MENAYRDREIELHFKNAKTFEYGKHVKNFWNVNNRNLAKMDNAYVARNVGKKSINDIIVNQIVEELYSIFNIVVNKDRDDVCVSSPKTSLSRVSALTNSVSCT